MANSATLTSFKDYI
jgi:hypothetical protein